MSEKKEEYGDEKQEASSEEQISGGDKDSSQSVESSKSSKGKVEKILYRAAIFLPLLLGLGAFVYFVKTRPQSEKQEEVKTPQVVRFFKVEPVTVRKIAIGYGRAQPSRNWRGYSEVQGRVLALGFSLFWKENVKSPSELIKYLKKLEEPLAREIWKGLEKDVQKEIVSHSPGDKIPSLLVARILKALNRLVINKNLQNQPFSRRTPSGKDSLPDRLSPREQDLLINCKIAAQTFPKALSPPSVLSVKEGHIFKRGQVICQIDPDEYYLLLEQRQVAIDQNQLQIEELEQRRNHLKEVISLEKKRAEILKGEYERRQVEEKKGAASPAQVEKELNQYLLQINKVKDLENSLNVIPTQIRNLEASIRLAKSQLQQARLDLRKTVIRAPFDLRLSENNIEFNQVVSPGQLLVSGYGIEKAEVVGQFQIRDVRRFLFPETKNFDFSSFLQSGTEKFFEKIKIPAQITLDLSPTDPEAKRVWTGYLSRVQSSLNTASQTIPLVATVSEPYRDMIPGLRPPLVKGMYCQVTLLGQELKGVYCLPRSAYRQGEIYLLREGKLVIKKAPLLFAQENYAIVQKGLQKGDKVILSDLFPAFSGQSLKGKDHSEPTWENFSSQVKREEK